MKLVVSKQGSVSAEAETPADVIQLMRLCGQKMGKDELLPSIGELAPKRKYTRTGKYGKNKKYERPGTGRRSVGQPWTCNEFGCGIVIGAKLRGVHGRWHKDHPGESYMEYKAKHPSRAAKLGVKAYSTEQPLETNTN